MDKLFEGEFGGGYPKEDAERKRQEADMIAELATITKRSFLDIIERLDQKLLEKILRREHFYNYIVANGSNQLLLEKLSAIH